MKKFLSLLLSSVMVLSMTAITFATENKIDSADNQPIRVSRTALDEIRENTRVMSEAESKRAIELINEKANAERLNNTPMTRSNSAEVLDRIARINDIENELEQLGATPLTLEEIYAIHGRTYRPGAPSEPNDTNYVNFYSLTTYIDNYEVYSIVAYSSGYSQSPLNVPFYTEGTAVIYDKDKYVENDFRKYIDMATSVGSSVFKEAFDRAPLLNYLGAVWDIGTYFNPTAQQKVTMNYVCGQTYIYSYVAEESIGYFDFMLTAERKQGSCVMSFGRYLAGDFTTEDTISYDYTIVSDHWADYDYAVQLHQRNSLQQAYRVGNIKFELDNRTADSFSMPYYNSIWNIPGV